MNDKKLEAGFYWARAFGKPPWAVVEVADHNGGSVMVSAGDASVVALPVEGVDFVGPLTPPAANWPGV